MKLNCTLLFVLLLCCGTYQLQAQNIIKGKVTEDETSEPLLGASVIVKGTGLGNVTDFDGNFELDVKDTPFPITLEVSYIGYSPKEVIVESASDNLKIVLGESAITTAVVEVRGQRISEKKKQSPLTVETLDNIAIKETAAANFYDGLGSLKGVDLTAASLGFKVINTRGFNSTSPVRSLQLIDGVDNQSPGLNFSLGNFLGSSELDVLKVDIVQGASSAFYGPGAFNGVINMETKNPFIHKGLSAMAKAGERNLFEGAIRWADAVNNKEGLPVFAYKLNFFYLRADDWVADNENPVDESRVDNTNPGRWDAVNTYGDEYFSLNDLSDPINLRNNAAGLGIYYRQGYREQDLVDYDTRNVKANVALHFRTQPEKKFESPEVIISSSLGYGTTVYQGDNRFSLRDILFFQNKVEFSKKNKYFLRAYMTAEDAGNSYDPYFTALRMQELAKSNEDWGTDYSFYWRNNIYGRMVNFEDDPYPVATIDPITFELIFDEQGARDWLVRNRDSLTVWHQWAADAANMASIVDPSTSDFYAPGTDRFQQAFDSITSLKNTEGGTRFFDQSALYHLAGGYTFNTEVIDEIKVGANYRLYRPESDGTVFKDTAGTSITNQEFGSYVGLQKNVADKWIFTATLRMDKNENFDAIFTPAASVVWTPNTNNYIRASFSSGVRNPTLTDQFLNLNVGRATLLGNLDGFNNLITVESLSDYLSNNFDKTLLDSFDVAPIKPERVRTFEIGYRGTLFDRLYVDASYYYSIYNDFIGFNIGIDAEFSQFGLPTQLDVFRVSANSTNEVTTEGFAIGLNYYFKNYYKISGNYSFNRLRKAADDDPIIPAFNTPEHKYNIGFSGRNIPLDLGFARINDFSFNINYKWIEGFLFEGSPQFTGFIDSYDMLDAQISFGLRKIDTTLKIGASNILDNRAFQTFGGPRIGRLGYISLLYDFKKK